MKKGAEGRDKDSDGEPPPVTPEKTLKEAVASNN